MAGPTPILLTFMCTHILLCLPLLAWSRVSGVTMRLRDATGPFPVSPVPALTGEVVHRYRLSPVKWFTGKIRPDHRSEPDIPVEMNSQGVIVDLVS